MFALKVRGKPADRGMLEKNRRRQVEPPLPLQRGRQRGQADRVETVLAEFGIRTDLRSGDLHLPGHQVDQRATQCLRQGGPRAGRGRRCLGRALRSIAADRRQGTGGAVTGHQGGHRLAPTVHHQQLRTRQRDALAQRVNPGIGGHGNYTDALRHLVRGRLVHPHAARFPQRPIDRKAVAAAPPLLHQPAAVGGVAVDKGVRRGVIGLAGITDHAGTGREEDQEVQWQFSRGQVQVTGAGHLGRHHLLQLVVPLVDQQTVPDHAGAVQHPVEAAMLGNDRPDQALHRVAVADIQLTVFDPGPARADPGQPLWIGRRTPGQDQGGPADAGVDRPREYLPKAAKAAGDQVDTAILPGRADRQIHRRTRMPAPHLTASGLVADLHLAGAGIVLQPLGQRPWLVQFDQLAGHLRRFELQAAQHRRQAADHPIAARVVDRELDQPPSAALAEQRTDPLQQRQRRLLIVVGGIGLRLGQYIAAATGALSGQPVLHAGDGRPVKAAQQDQALAEGARPRVTRRLVGPLRLEQQRFRQRIVAVGRDRIAWLAEHPGGQSLHQHAELALGIEQLDVQPLQAVLGRLIVALPGVGHPGPHAFAAAVQHLQAFKRKRQRRSCRRRQMFPAAFGQHHVGAQAQGDRRLQRRVHQRRMQQVVIEAVMLARRQRELGQHLSPAQSDRLQPLVGRTVLKRHRPVGLVALLGAQPARIDPGRERCQVRVALWRRLGKPRQALAVQHRLAGDQAGTRVAFAAGDLEADLIVVLQRQRNVDLPCLIVDDQRP